MKQLTRIKTALVLLALAGGTAAGEAPKSPAEAGTQSNPPGDSPMDWAQTRLKPEPALQEQYKKTRAFLDEKVTEVDGQISRLKTDGVLDRRSATTIRSALNNARVSMTGMAGGMQEEEPVDGWTARMFAYELGMAADTLTRQAVQIVEDLDATAEGKVEPKARQPQDPDQQRQLAQTLIETSGLLRETARAITDNLK